MVRDCGHDIEKWKKALPDIDEEHFTNIKNYDEKNDIEKLNREAALLAITVAKSIHEKGVEKWMAEHNSSSGLSFVKLLEDGFKPTEKKEEGTPIGGLVDKSY